MAVGWRHQKTTACFKQFGVRIVQIGWKEHRVMQGAK
jgi:hypothetical protein